MIPVTELTHLTIAEARDGLKAKTFSALELAKAHIAAMEKARALNAYVLETPEQARAMARQADGRIAKGEGGPLNGLPLCDEDQLAAAVSAAANGAVQTCTMLTPTGVLWQTIIHCVFILSAIGIAVTDRIMQSIPRKHAEAH